MATQPDPEDTIKPDGEILKQPPAFLSDPGSKALSDPASKALSDPASMALSDPASKALSDPASKALSDPASKALSDPASKALLSDPASEAQLSDPASKAQLSDPASKAQDAAQAPAGAGAEAAMEWLKAMVKAANDGGTGSQVGSLEQLLRRPETVDFTKMLQQGMTTPQPSVGSTSVPSTPAEAPTTPYLLPGCRERGRVNRSKMQDLFRQFVLAGEDWGETEIDLVAKYGREAADSIVAQKEKDPAMWMSNPDDPENKDRCWDSTLEAEEAMVLANSNMLEISGFAHQLAANNVDEHLIQALVHGMNSQKQELREKRDAVEVAVAQAMDEESMAPRVYQLNNQNAIYREASKHVKVHLAKPKAKAKSAPAPKKKSR
ncbi:unnamed protein product [Symbiodinium sp. KB8]|nr:unnamed protein product [Symbiodinium sp. KB8]